MISLDELWRSPPPARASLLERIRVEDRSSEVRTTTVASFVCLSTTVMTTRGR